MYQFFFVLGHQYKYMGTDLVTPKYSFDVLAVESRSVYCPTVDRQLNNSILIC